MREALDAMPGVSLEEGDTDHFLPPYRTLAMRVANRLLYPLQFARWNTRCARKYRFDRQKSCW
jgi:hypothetical protein